MARAAYFISQETLGKEQKLFVPQKLQTDYGKKGHVCIPGLVPPERAVLCLEEITFLCGEQ